MAYNRVVVQKLAIYFAEHGLPISYQAFKKDGKKPYTDKTVRAKVGAYQVLLGYIKKDWPQYWQLAQPQELPSAVDDAANVMSKQDPLASLRASTTEK